MKKTILFFFCIALLSIGCDGGQPIDKPTDLFTDEGVDLEDAELVEVDDDGEIADGTGDDANADDDTETERTLGDDVGTVVLGCEPLRIDRTSSCDAHYGEEAVCDLAVAGACNAFSCSQASGPEWASVDGTNLKVTPTELGSHSVVVRCVEDVDASRFTDKTIEVPVEDDVSLSFYLGNSESLADAGESARAFAENQEFTSETSDVPCVHVTGHASSYTITATGHSGRLLPLQSGPTWACFGVELEQSEELTLASVRFRTEDEFGNASEADVALTFRDLTCEEPIQIELVRIRQNNDVSTPDSISSHLLTGGEPQSGLATLEVELGREFFALFKVTGGAVDEVLGENPASIISTASHIYPNEITCEYDWYSEYECRWHDREGEAHQDYSVILTEEEADFATENNDWVIEKPSRSSHGNLIPNSISDEDLATKYVVLKSSYGNASFADKSLPLFDWPDILPEEVLTITVTSPTCEANRNEMQSAAFVMEHTLHPKRETIADVKCHMEVHDVEDVGPESRFDLYFSEEREAYGDTSVESDELYGVWAYPINDCRDNNSGSCGAPRAVSVRNNGNEVNLGDVTNINIHVEDSGDNINADVLWLTCRSNFWEFYIYDSFVCDRGGRIDDNIRTSSGNIAIYQSYVTGESYMWTPRYEPNWNGGDEGRRGRLTPSSMRYVCGE